MTGKLGPKIFPSSKIQTVASSHFLMLICHQAQYQKHFRREFKEAVSIAKISGSSKMVAGNFLDKYVQQSMQGSD